MGRLILAMTGFAAGVALAVVLSARRELQQNAGSRLGDEPGRPRA